jgi:hypothetical protein
MSWLGIRNEFSAINDHLPSVRDFAVGSFQRASEWGKKNADGYWLTPIDCR